MKRFYISFVVTMITIWISSLWLMIHDTSGFLNREVETACVVAGVMVKCTAVYPNEGYLWIDITAVVAAVIVPNIAWLIVNRPKVTRAS